MYLVRAVALLVVAVASPVRAQQSALRSGLSFDLGWAPYQVRETVLNDVRHAGSVFLGGLSYRLPARSAERRFELQLAVGTVGSRFESGRPSYAINTRFNYRDLRPIRSGAGTMAFLLGGAVGWEGHYAFYEQWDESHAYWLTSYYLGVSGAVHHRRPGGSVISLEMTTPLVALVSRPPPRFTYKELDGSLGWLFAEFHRDLTLVSPADHLALDITLRYRPGGGIGPLDGFYWRFLYLHTALSGTGAQSILSHTFGLTVRF